MNNTTAATVTREALKNGKFRFRVNGEVTLKASTRSYEWASLYQTPEGKVVAWFHARQDLAVKGNSEANGISDLKRVGITEIAEYTPGRELTKEELAEVQRGIDLDTIAAELDTNPWDEKTTEQVEDELVDDMEARLAAEEAKTADAPAPAKKAEKKAAPKKPAAPRRSEVREAAEGMKVVKTKNYTVKEVSELLAASPISVNRWVQMGKLTAVKSDPKEGRVVNLIPGSSVAEFLKGRADRAKAAEKAKADKEAKAKAAADKRQAAKDAKAAKEKAKLDAAKAQAAKVTKKA